MTKLTELVWFLCRAVSDLVGRYEHISGVSEHSSFRFDRGAFGSMSTLPQSRRQIGLTRYPPSIIPVGPTIYRD